jgi:hypothetical protein
MKLVEIFYFGLSCIKVMIYFSNTKWGTMDTFIGIKVKFSLSTP